MRKTILCGLVSALSIIAPASLEARLGETKSSAEGRSAAWNTKYGAVVPIINTDSEGKVVQECWSGPPEGWTKATALKFAMELMPVAAQKKEPTQVKVDGHFTIFAVGDQYRVYLSGFQGTIYDLEVATTAYFGERC